MFDARTIFTLAVSFLTDFFAGLVTGLGGGVIATNGTVSSTGMVLPGKAVWVFAIMGALVAALRGLQKNLAEPVASPAVVQQRRMLQMAGAKAILQATPGGDS